ncbi:hypothetical protein DMUE_1917 [Dictyocoela muelleri]|nr:hypothetical protein DMUE_1917 [Dictyocoela muelleri]
MIKDKNHIKFLSKILNTSENYLEILNKLDENKNLSNKIFKKIIGHFYLYFKEASLIIKNDKIKNSCINNNKIKNCCINNDEKHESLKSNNDHKNNNMNSNNDEISQNILDNKSHCTFINICNNHNNSTNTIIQKLSLFATFTENILSDLKIINLICAPLKFQINNSNRKALRNSKYSDTFNLTLQKICIKFIKEHKAENIKLLTELLKKIILLDNKEVHDCKFNNEFNNEFNNNTIHDINKRINNIYSEIKSFKTCIENNIVDYYESFIYKKNNEDNLFVNNEDNIIVNNEDNIFVNYEDNNIVNNEDNNIVYNEANIVNNEDNNIVNNEDNNEEVISIIKKTLLVYKKDNSEYFNYSKERIIRILFRKIIQKIDKHIFSILENEVETLYFIYDKANIKDELFLKLELYFNKREYIGFSDIIRMKKNYFKNDFKNKNNEFINTYSDCDSKRVDEFIKSFLIKHSNKILNDFEEIDFIMRNKKSFTKKELVDNNEKELIDNYSIINNENELINKVKYNDNMINKNDNVDYNDDIINDDDMIDKRCVIIKISEALIFLSKYIPKTKIENQYRHLLLRRILRGEIIDYENELLLIKLIENHIFCYKLKEILNSKDENKIILKMSCCPKYEDLELKIDEELNSIIKIKISKEKLNKKENELKNKNDLKNKKNRYKEMNKKNHEKEIDFPCINYDNSNILISHILSYCEVDYGNLTLKLSIFQYMLLKNMLNCNFIIRNRTDKQVIDELKPLVKRIIKDNNDYSNKYELIESHILPLIEKGLIKRKTLRLNTSFEEKYSKTVNNGNIYCNWNKHIANNNKQIANIDNFNNNHITSIDNHDNKICINFIPEPIIKKEIKTIQKNKNIDHFQVSAKIIKIIKSMKVIKSTDLLEKVFNENIILDSGKKIKIDIYDKCIDDLIERGYIVKRGDSYTYLP